MKSTTREAGASLSLRQRHMRQEFAFVRRQARTHHRRFDLIVKKIERIRALYPDMDQSGGTRRSEIAHSFQAKFERRRFDGFQRQIDIVSQAFFDIADESQGEVHILRLNPASARNSAGKRRKIEAYRLGKRDGNEQTYHGGIVNSVSRLDPD